MPSPLYGVDDRGDARPIRANKRGRVFMVDSGLLWVLVGLEALQLAALVIILAGGL